MKRRALVIGIGGQVGSYLAELLLLQGYEVHGLIRKASNFNTQRIDHIFDALHLHHGDLSDVTSLSEVIQKARPDECYNLAAQSHVRVSFDMPIYTGQTTGTGAAHVFEALRRIKPDTRIYQASSTEMFGSSPPPHNELSPMHPASPYAAAKLYAYHMAKIYRTAYGMFICNGILTNMESPRRGMTFVTRKITRGIAFCQAGLQKNIELGDLWPRRDWMHARDGARGMWLMLQADKPGDYALGTGVSHTVQNFIDEAASWAGYRPDIVRNEHYCRPVEVPELRVDAHKARANLAWTPTKSFAEIVQEMIAHDIAQVKKHGAAA